MTDGAEQILRRHGLQVTAQRIAVLDAVRARSHATADELVDAVRDRIGSVSRQAVYDALGALAEKGVIRRIQPARSPARYEGRTDDNHHHMVCRSCGRVEDVDCSIGRTPCLEPSDDHGYSVDEAEVIFWGYCPQCMAGDTGAPARQDATVNEPTHP